jgi:hypothetical protein
MQQFAIKLSLGEIQALLELVDNQLFRMKYIDSRIPGHKNNPEKLGLATSAVSALRETFNKAKGFTAKGAA